MVRPDQKREAVRVMNKKGIPIARACKFTGLSRSAYYEKAPMPDTESIQVVKAIAGRYQRLGYRMLHAILRNEEGSRMNHKKFFRIYHEQGLALKRRKLFGIEFHLAYQNKLVSLGQWTLSLTAQKMDAQ